jgi:hypothetical protein
MIKITTLLWVALLIVAGGTVMHVSYKVRHVQRHLNEIARDAQQQKGALVILSAEWDSLNDPKRLDDLSKRFLELSPTPIQRVVALESLPIRPTPEQAALIAEAAKKNGKDRAGAAQKPIETSTAKALPRPALPAQTASATVAPRDDVGLILARLERRE